MGKGKPSEKVKIPGRGTAKAMTIVPVMSADVPAGDRLAALNAALMDVRAGNRLSPRTTKLIVAGPPKMAQKVVEEAAEVAIEAVLKSRVGVINESADLLYNLVVLWNALGIDPSEIWREMDRREVAFGMAEKLPKMPADEV